MNVIEKAEEIVLGTILSIPEFQESIITELKQEWFTIEANKIIFSKIKELYEKGSGIDILTITHSLDKKEAEKTGGAYYVSKLTSHIGSGTNYMEHIRILQDNYMRTNLIRVCQEEVVRLADRTHDIEETNLKLTMTLERLFLIQSGDSILINELIKKRLDVYDTIKPGELLGLPTGHSKLDKITNGFQPGDLIILAARPSMGKTAMSLLFARRTVLDGNKAQYYSLEMPSFRLADRIISLETNIDSNKLQSGKLKDWEWSKLTNMLGGFVDAPLLINDEAGLTVEQIWSYSLKELSKGAISMIIVDFLQLVEHSGGGASTNDKVGHVSKRLKALAKKCNCPIIVLSQLSRAVEQRAGDKRPQLSDLRDSGNIEQDADVVMFLHRPEYYGINEDSEGNSTKNLIEIIVAKNRNGPLGTTHSYKSDDWSYIGEMPKEELDSFVEMPYNSQAGLEPNLEF